MVEDPPKGYLPVPFYHCLLTLGDNFFVSFDILFIIPPSSPLFLIHVFLSYSFVYFSCILTGFITCFYTVLILDVSLGGPERAERWDKNLIIK